MLIFKRLQKAATFIPKVIYGTENTIFITPQLLNLILSGLTNTYVQFYKSTGFRIDPKNVVFLAKDYKV
jgi:hypothetical protein